jgi:hypothetical protein
MRSRFLLRSAVGAAYSACSFPKDVVLAGPGFSSGSVSTNMPRLGNGWSLQPARVACVFLRCQRLAGGYIHHCCDYYVA